MYSIYPFLSTKTPSHLSVLPLLFHHPRHNTHTYETNTPGTPRTQDQQQMKIEQKAPEEESGDLREKIFHFITSSYLVTEEKILQDYRREKGIRQPRPGPTQPVITRRQGRVEEKEGKKKDKCKGGYRCRNLFFPKKRGVGGRKVVARNVDSQDAVLLMRKIRGVERDGKKREKNPDQPDSARTQITKPKQTKEK